MRFYVLAEAVRSKAVSYTHLDVYKRQVLKSVVKDVDLQLGAMGRGDFTVSPQAEYIGDYVSIKNAITNISESPVSYTHLPQNHSSKVNLLIDIQAKLQAGKGVGYEKWAKVFNLKEAAKTLNFLTDNGLTDYDELAARAEEAGQKFDAASARIKQIEARLSELSELRTHITSYSKTRAVYAAFRKTKDKKEYRLAHESELAMHEAAKKAFDKLGGTKIPTVAQIQKEDVYKRQHLLVSMELVSIAII